jgi:stage III sporulation protein AC
MQTVLQMKLLILELDHTEGAVDIGVSRLGGGLSSSKIRAYDCKSVYLRLAGPISKEEVIAMDIQVIFQIAAVGILVAVLNLVLMRAGREEQAMMTTLAGLVVVLFWVIQYISQLFTTVQEVFKL